MSFDAIVFEAVRAARVAVNNAITAARNTITGHVTTESTGVKTHVTNAKTEIVTAVNDARIKSIQRGVLIIPPGATIPPATTIPITPVNLARSQLRIVWGRCVGEDGGQRAMAAVPTLNANSITFTHTLGARVELSWEVTEWH